jgi:hypothetical protein
MVEKEGGANRVGSSRRQMYPVRASVEAIRQNVNFMSSDSRARMNNPNLAGKDFNPILHVKGPQGGQMQDHTTTYKDYGAAGNSRRREQDSRLIAPNTTAGSNAIF